MKNSVLSAILFSLSVSAFCAQFSLKNKTELLVFVRLVQDGKAIGYDNRAYYWHPIAGNSELTLDVAYRPIEIELNYCASGSENITVGMRNDKRVVNPCSAISMDMSVSLPHSKFVQINNPENSNKMMVKWTGAKIVPQEDRSIKNNVSEKDIKNN